jgi:hypothetical protein
VNSCPQALQRALEESRSESEALRQQAAGLEEERAALREALDDQGSLLAELQVGLRDGCGGCGRVMGRHGLRRSGPLRGVVDDQASLLLGLQVC